MVVTGSRHQAVKYKLSFDGYIQKKGYTNIRCLVAFSGEVTDDDAPGVTYTEVQMNGGIKEIELRDKFASDGHQVLLVAQVVGESMNRKIPNGAWCLWRLNPAGSRQGKVVLAQHNDIEDSELGSYTVKVYESEKVATADGSWRHSKVTLKPDSTDAKYEPLVFEGLEEGELRIVAELVRVVG